MVLGKVSNLEVSWTATGFRADSSARKRGGPFISLVHTTSLVDFAVDVLWLTPAANPWAYAAATAGTTSPSTSATELETRTSSTGSSSSQDEHSPPSTTFRINRSWRQSAAPELAAEYRRGCSGGSISSTLAIGGKHDGYFLRIPTMLQCVEQKTSHH